jgi:hypothetical protein
MIDDDLWTPELWMRDARCADVEDPDLFFSGMPEDIAKAQAICKECPVRLLCASYAIENNAEGGVWGGLTEADRKTIKASKRRSRKGIPNKKH